MLGAIQGGFSSRLYSRHDFSRGCSVRPNSVCRRSLVTRAGELPPDFQDKAQGARDPFAGELGTQFTSKPLGNADTLHIIRPPTGMDRITGLRSKRCKPCEAGKVQALDSRTSESLRNQVPGWRLVMDKAGHPCIQQEWKFLNFVASIEFFRRVGTIAEHEGHHPDLHLEDWNRVWIQLSTHSAGGLTENDFILAAKINDIEISDLRQRAKAKPRNFV